MNTSSRARPASASNWSSSLPERPTNGRPCLSSLAPGASPTSITSATGLPSPGTMCVAFSQISKPQPECLRIVSCRASNDRGRFMLATLLATTALLGGAQFPETFPVPPGSQPEGIASAGAKTLYVSSRANGSVYRADARTGQGTVFVPPQAGRSTFGLKVSGKRLFAAGGPTGFGYVFNARTGADVDAVDFGGGFVNDVAVTRKAAYFTDSNKPFIYVYPRGRRAGDPFPLAITGDFVYGPGFNANGIAAARGGKTLILVQSSTGKLFTANARTGATKLIQAPLVPNGDGILLRGRTLYVVRNQDNEVAKLRLDRRLRTGRLVDEITDPDFDTPTTIAALGRRLYAVNARFTAPTAPDTPYSVVKVG